MSEMYHGVSLDNQKDKKILGETVDNINEIIDYISRENYIKKALLGKEEVFGVYLFPNGQFVCHIHNGDISFSKIHGGDISEITSEDIRYLCKSNVISEYSRMFNKAAFAVLTKQRENEDFVSKDHIAQIRAKDFSPENRFRVKDLRFVVISPEVAPSVVETNDRLREKVRLAKMGCTARPAGNPPESSNKIRNITGCER